MRAKVDSKVCNGTGLCEQMRPNISKRRRGMCNIKGDEVSLNADVEGTDARIACLKDIFTKYLE